jgi:hypothetical protein
MTRTGRVGYSIAFAWWTGKAVPIRPMNKATIRRIVSFHSPGFVGRTIPFKRDVVVEYRYAPTSGLDEHLEV